MDEFEFQRVLNLFPIVRPRDYHADTVSSRQSTAQTGQSELKEWQDAWDVADGNEIPIQGNEPDAFWRKLKMAAEKKVGAAKAERFCNAFQKIHKKLVNEELSLEAASKFLSS
ncbi:uncharacterized protein LOC130770458 isoform X2 [Actinidia eriantha]|uniref:uncharacterized protein LOC130770458 isoform X2 n=1 Tax=Actinidia eriantha TaxID=165200 RepID=UPI00258DF721|nr:uncharacterized protein LOC130770458 isoform X2 [Actinidia eriantha]